jgi:class 3 adenylate cyclase
VSNEVGATATCASCGAANAATQRFCGDCGSPLARGCPNCGAPHTPGQRFCGDCGSALASQPAAAAAATDREPVAVPHPGPAPAAPPAVAPRELPAGSTGPIAERRLVSVLFADLVGFTPFSEERDAEDVRDTLSRYFDLATEVIVSHGGTVEKFIGDAVIGPRRSLGPRRRTTPRGTRRARRGRPSVRLRAAPPGGATDRKAERRPRAARRARRLADVTLGAGFRRASGLA